MQQFGIYILCVFSPRASKFGKCENC